MGRPRILVTESKDDSVRAQEILRSIGEVDFCDLSRQELLEKISAYDALVVRLRNRIDAEVLSRAPSLRCVATPTTGLNHIDLDIAKRSGVHVISLRGESEFLESVSATAELTWGLVLSLTRRLSECARGPFVENWDRDALKGVDLAGRTLGIIGLGRLGKKVARYGIAFGMNVLAFDADPSAVLEGVEAVSLEKLLERSDVVSLHVSFSSSSVRLVGEKEFSLMKPTAYFVNTSRGECMDEAALLKALSSGKLAGAALDVLSGENSGRADWTQNDPLIQFSKKDSRLILTPHIGGASRDAMEKTEIFIAQKLKKMFEEK